MFATARDEKSLEDLKAIGIEPIHLEITDPQQIQEARKYVEERTGGKLDILVNNACVRCSPKVEQKPIMGDIVDAITRSRLSISTLTK